MTTTSEIVASMLTENTGRHFLDSGGAYGRNWERNQGATADMFAARPDAYIEWRWGLSITLDLFHFLVNACEYVEAMDDELSELADEMADAGWLEIAEEFPTWYAERHGLDAPGGLYGDSSGPFTVNTYNGEDLLSQTIQYVYFELDGAAYVVLQVHGGCDVRGGYTRPRVFSVSEDTYPWILNNAQASIYCQGVPEPSPQLPDMPAGPFDHYWYTDDGCNLYFQGASGDRSEHLESYEIVESDDVSLGQITVTPDGVGHCPLCGGELVASY